jgi:hypothetical protein
MKKRYTKVSWQFIEWVEDIITGSTQVDFDIGEFFRE